jgi:DNA-binding MarR family transcriptional regulator
MALRFFARANQFSRNPSAFAGFQATTRGTATQTIKSLEAGGYLVRQPSKADRRSVSLRLTSKGKKALARDPFEVLVRAVDSLDAKDRSAMRLALVFVRTARTSAEMRCNPPSEGPSAAECLLLAVQIQPSDVGLLCVHFQPNEHRDGAQGECVDLCNLREERQ